MRFLVFLSNTIIPLLIFYIVATGLSKKRNIYEDFIKGAADGFQTVIGIMPTLIGLMVAVGVLRASGFLDFLSEILGGLMSFVHFPSELVPVTIVKLFSSSAAAGLLIDIFKEFGPDSSLGTTSSLIMSCTETIFYTMSVYFMAAHVRKSRYTLAGALLTTFVGTAASVILAGLM